MRLLTFLFAVALTACDPDSACHSLKPGQSTSGLPIGSPVTTYSKLFSAPTGNGYQLGDAVGDYCCAVTMSMAPCDTVDCSGRQGITARKLDQPYTRVVSAGPSDDASSMCFVAEQDGTITSVWIKIYVD